MLDTSMSIEGDMVFLNSRSRLYMPVFMNSVRTLFSLDAQMRLLTGSPISRAYHEARILPKLPVGTVIFIFSPSLISPAASRSAYAEK